MLPLFGGLVAGCLVTLLLLSGPGLQGAARSSNNSLVRHLAQCDGLLANSDRLREETLRAGSMAEANSRDTWAKLVRSRAELESDRSRCSHEAKACEAKAAVYDVERDARG